MLVWYDFNEPELKRIAAASGVKQVAADVSYARRMFHLKRPEEFFCARTEHGFVCATKTNSSMRIICIAIEKDYQRKGLGTILLNLAIKNARGGGY